MSSPVFTKLAMTLAPAYTCFSCSWVAVRHGVAWEVRYCRVLFYGMTPSPPPEEVHVTTAFLRASRTFQEIEDPVGFMNEILADPMLLPRRELGELIEVAQGVAPVFHTFYPPETPGAYRMATLRREVPRLRDCVDTPQLDIELLACTTPYDGITDLYSELGLPPDGFADTKPSVLDLTLLPVAHITKRSSLKDGVMHLEIEATSKAPTKGLRVGVKGFKKSGVTRFSVDGETCEWTSAGEHVLGTADVRATDVPIALVTLSLGGEFLHRWWLRDDERTFNSTLDIHRAIDATDVFRSSFFDKHKDDFEERVALLFTLLGATVLSYGKIPRLTDAPDLLVSTAAGQLYVVECTTGDINAKGKLHRLHERTKLIRERLASSPSRPTTVQPVICTSAPRVETMSHWSTARSFGIAIIAMEELSHLMRQLEAPPSADQMVEYAHSLIPSG
ncbi:MAG: hypothetical protein JWM36_2759 [Hyphomicrobiales bacterium]|nr:hypothetical protein [Hyphomicrobiales bacterium]